MKRLLVALLVCASLVYAAPRNKPVVQPSVWNGYGDVDWCFASLRVGIANKDSLLEDGWALIDSLNLTYGEIDSLNVVNFGSDTVSVIYLFADTASISVATLDSIKSTLGDIDTLNTDSLHSILGSIDTLVVTSSLGDSLDFNIGLIDTLSSDSIHVESILATNNISGNDLIASDSLIAVTGNFSGPVVSSSSVTGSVGTFSSVYAGTGAWYSTATYLSNLLTALFYGVNGVIISGGPITARVVIGGPSEAATAVTYLNSTGGTSTGFLNLLQNSDFAAVTGWALYGCTISGGKLNKLTIAGTGTAIQGAANMPIVASSTYLIRVDVDSLSAGASIAVALGGTTFGSLTSEGADQWLMGVTTNNSGAFTITWDTGETGILDNVYVYRLAGKFIFGGEVWNARQSATSATYTILTGDHVVTLNHADSIVVTLPALVDCWNVLTNSGRELVIENSGSGYAVIWAAAADLANNVIMGADSIHLAQYECVTLYAVSNKHWVLQQ